ncbi:DinB family protein [Algoriphagus ratkowskyi]|uniref:DinB family protein n=1 Tax=Algoriphagus ratkowskyi TaxID=57028 RepID=A0A2W7R5B1_9BACT|nr:DinB family protein [Algoriphagus ratkowskyi]PZX55351.1 DinB family protein [Algoriphagus ratkowskyi]TXD79718.1 DinB family protein [Algoriphagus ratkowskyi]
MKSQPEVWLRGPIDSYPLALQPVVHAILQAHEEIHELMQDFPSELLWEKPAGMASPGFHLQHMAGVMDRLATYAEGKMLSKEQLAYLKNEGVSDGSISSETLVKRLDIQIKKFLQLVSEIDPNTVYDFRGVGRAQLPSTVNGLLFHAAEHIQRHFGQLLVTVNVLVLQRAEIG